MNPSQKNATTPTHPGLRLDLPSKRNFFSLKYWRRVVTVVNAILNSKVVLGPAGQFNISDNNAIFTIPDQSASVAASTDHPFKITQTAPGDPDAWLNIQVQPGTILYRQLTNTLAQIGYVAATNYDTDIACVEDSNNIVYLDIDSHLIVVTDTDDGFWPAGFGISCSNRFVIGNVDTTDTTGKILGITQYVTASQSYFIDSLADVTSSTANVPTITFYNSIGNFTWEPWKTLVWGLAGVGFPSTGLYIYIGDGTGVGPGGNYLKT